MSERTIRRKTAIVGVGESAYYKRGQSPLDEFGLAVTAVRAAAADAGLPLKALDGLASFSFDFTDPVRLSTALGFAELRFSNMFWGGGGGGACGAVGNAVAAVAAGYAEAVVVLRSIRQGARRFGEGYVTPMGATGYNLPHGVLSPAHSVALKTRRFMHDWGIGQDALAAVALASYEHAQHNPRAVMYGRPLTREAYDASRWIVEPFHLYDCCQENDGATALIVTSAERAQDLRNPSVYVLGAAQGTNPSSDIFDHGAEPYAAANYSDVAKRLYAMAGIDPADVDVAQVYENFTGGTVISMIEHGLCRAEEANAFFTLENLRWDTGTTPLNTSGGNLAECYVHGLELVAEGVRQIRGTSTCQVKDPEVCLVAAAPMSAPASNLLLGR